MGRIRHWCRRMDLESRSFRIVVHRRIVALGSTLDVRPVGSNCIADSRRSRTLRCRLCQCIDHCIQNRRFRPTAAAGGIDCRLGNNS